MTMGTGTVDRLQNMPSGEFDRRFGMVNWAMIWTSWSGACSGIWSKRHGNA